jgi:hypothetical protein
MKQKFIIPESWNEVTIKQYISMATLKGTNEIQDLIELLHILTNVSKDTIKQIDPNELDTINSALQWLTTSPDVNNMQDSFTINNEVYKYSRELDKMTIGEMVSYEMLVEQHRLTEIETLPYILAIILRKVDEDNKLEVFNSDIIYDRVTLFQDNLTIGETMGLLFFFKSGGRNYTTIIGDYLSQLKQLTTKIMKTA